jgi:hypothetical protein
MGTGLFPGVKRPERGVNHPPHLAEVKKEYSYTYSLPLGLHGLSGVKMTFYLTIIGIYNGENICIGYNQTPRSTDKRHYAADINT